VHRGGLAAIGVESSARLMPESNCPAVKLRPDRRRSKACSVRRQLSNGKHLAVERVYKIAGSNGQGDRGVARVEGHGQRVVEFGPRDTLANARSETCAFAWPTASLRAASSSTALTTAGAFHDFSSASAMIRWPPGLGGRGREGSSPRRRVQVLGFRQHGRHWAVQIGQPSFSSAASCLRKSENRKSTLL